LLSLTGTSVTVYNEGYVITINLDGTFNPSTIDWVAGSCGSGTPYLDDGNTGAGGVQTFYKTLAWSGEANQWYVVTGTATDDLVTSIQQPGTTSYTDTPPSVTGYAPYVTYFSPGNYSTETGGARTGSYSCNINVPYAQNYMIDGSESAYHLVTSGNPETEAFYLPPDDTSTYTEEFGIDFSGWTLAAFSPQTTLGWPAFNTCTVDVYQTYNGDGGTYSGTLPYATTTKSCVAAPLILAAAN